MITTSRPVGDYLREWRQRRRMSQLDLAGEARISTRHLSFMETGRALPSREMVLRLCERLQIPLRERNAVLVAAGYAPLFPERRLDDPALQPAREAIALVLAGHEPYPALAVDRHWNMVASNASVPPLLSGVDPALLQAPCNVLRLSLHPNGLGPRIANHGQWRAHLFDRLHRQIEQSGDPLLSELLAELEGYPLHFGTRGTRGTRGTTGTTDTAETSPPDQPGTDYARLVVPLQLHTEFGMLSFISTTTVFGTPVDVTLSELALESFFPADRATAQALQAMSKRQAA